MIPVKPWSFALLFSQALAAGLIPDAACKTADACYKQVRQNGNHPAGPGCTAWFAKTVIPCPVYRTTTTSTTITRTATITRAAVTKSTTTTVTVTDAGPPAPGHPTGPTGPAGPAVAARAVEGEVIMDAEEVVAIRRPSIEASDDTNFGDNVLDDQKRSKCSGPRTTSTTEVPGWVAKCTNPAAYSSACSCLNAPHQTTTARAPTVQATSTKSFTTDATVTKDSTTTVTATATITCHQDPGPAGMMHCHCDPMHGGPDCNGPQPPSN